MGRGARQKETASHWTDHHPDSRHWTPHQRALAGMMTQAAYEGLYGRAISTIDFLAKRPSPETRQAATEALRKFAAGDREELLAIVREWGEPEWGEGSFLESVYKRAFGGSVQAYLKESYGQKILKKDPAMEAMFLAHGRDFYQRLQSEARGEEAQKPLPENWPDTVLATPESPLGENISEGLRAMPLLESDPDLARALLRRGPSPELQSALNREYSQAIEFVLSRIGFWEGPERVQMSGKGDYDRDLLVFRHTKNPVLHLRDPNVRYASLCGKHGGYQGKSDGWQMAGAGQGYRRCKECEKALGDAQTPEVKELAARLNGDNSTLELLGKSPEECRDAYGEALASEEVQSALLEFQEGGNGESLHDTLVGPAIELALELDRRRAEEVRKEGGGVSAEWRPWSRNLSITLTRDLREAGLLDDEEDMRKAFGAIFSEERKRALLHLRARKVALSSRGAEREELQQLQETFGEIISSATEKYITREKPTQNDEAHSQ